MRTLEALHRRYAGLIYDKCIRMLGQRGDAEDAVQETFVNAFRALETFTYGESHLPWLYRIATNVCIKQIQARKRRQVITAVSAEVAPKQASKSSEDLLALRQTLEHLVAELDGRNLEIIIAYYLDGMTQEQIADQLGISRRAVVKRLTKLKQRLTSHTFGEVMTRYGSTRKKARL